MLAILVYEADGSGTISYYVRNSKGETVGTGWDDIKFAPDHKLCSFLNYWYEKGYNDCLDEILGEEE